ncbi:MAG: ferritin-like domain-containing protein, partial [Rhizomicrobium sp.]
GAQEYAANQTREEARHVTAFTRYIQARWGKPVSVGHSLGNLLNELVASPLVWKKLVGMQMLVEGLAMGAFAMFFKEARDPVMRQVCQLVMTDEAFHHKSGKIWAERTIPYISRAEHETIEDWAAQVFQILLFNLGRPDQKPWIYEAVGLDPVWCQSAFLEGMTEALIREELRDSANIFRVLVKTLLNAGIITDRTRGVYAAYLDMAELHAESGRMVGDDIAEEGIRYLFALNGKSRGVTPASLAAE